MTQRTAGRIVGVDVARGLAVLGMFGAHVTATQPFDWGDAGSWTDVINGRSSILFALLAGVSLAILTGRDRPVIGRDLARARGRILMRALVLFALGLLLLLPETNVAVILHYYAVYFVLALPLLRVPPAALFALAFAVAVIMPFVLHGPRTELGSVPDVPVAVAIPLDLLVTGYYPALLWIAFVLAGLGIGRLRLRSARVQTALLVTGTALAALGYGAGTLLGGRGLASLDPHSGTSFEVVGSGGFAIAVLGACLLLSRVIRPLLFPVAAVGSMALTAYTGQLLAIAVFQVPVPGQEGSLAWLWFTIVALAACTAWALLIGKGPLERGLSWLADRAGAPPPGSRLDDRAATGEGDER